MSVFLLYCSVSNLLTLISFPYVFYLTNSKGPGSFSYHMINCTVNVTLNLPVPTIHLIVCDGSRDPPQGQVLSQAMNGSTGPPQRPLSPAAYPPPPASLHMGLHRQSRSSGEGTHRHTRIQRPHCWLFWLCLGWPHPDGIVLFGSSICYPQHHVRPQSSIEYDCTQSNKYWTVLDSQLL